MGDAPLLTPTAVYSASVPLIIGAVEMLKRVSPARWWKFAPLAAVLLGLGVGLGVATGFPSSGEPWIVVVMNGLGVGLAASGLYSSSKSLARPM